VLENTFIHIQGIGAKLNLEPLLAFSCETMKGSLFNPYLPMA
jgi:hypothetical protein